jgi:hypothetical protein
VFRRRCYYESKVLTKKGRSAYATAPQRLAASQVLRVVYNFFLDLSNSRLVIDNVSWLGSDIALLDIVINIFSTG